MATADVTPDRFRECFQYNPSTGALYWKVSRGRVAAGAKVAFVRTDGYVGVSVDGVRCVAHRVIWAIVYGHHPEHQIDHVNGDRQDNRIKNLRDVPHLVNMQNMRDAQSHNKYGHLLGAHFHKNDRRWRSNINVGGKLVSLGAFDTEQQAHEAYVQAKRAYHPGCTI